MSFVATAIVGGAVIGGIASNKAAKKGAEASADASNQSINAQNRQLGQTRADQLPWMRAGAGAVDMLSQITGISAQASQNPLSYDDWAAKNVGYDAAFEQDKAKAKGSSARWASGEQARRDAENRGKYQSYVANFKPEEVAPTTGTNSALSLFQSSPGYQFMVDENQKAIDRSAASKGGALSGRAIKESQRVATGLAAQDFNNFYNRLAGIAGLGQNANNTVASVGANTANNNSAAIINAGNARASGYMASGEGVNKAVQGGASNLLMYKYINAAPASDGTNFSQKPYMSVGSMFKP